MLKIVVFECFSLFRVPLSQQVSSEKRLSVNMKANQMLTKIALDLLFICNKVKKSFVTVQ